MFFKWVIKDCLDWLDDNKIIIALLVIVIASWLWAAVSFARLEKEQNTHEENRLRTIIREEIKRAQEGG